MENKKRKKRACKIAILTLFPLLSYSQDSIKISNHELRCFLRDYTNAPMKDSIISQQDSVISLQRIIISNDSITLNSCNNLVKMQDNTIDAYRVAHESEQDKVKEQRRGKTLWQVIAGLISGLFIYKTILP